MLTKSFKARGDLDDKEARITLARSFKKQPFIYYRIDIRYKIAPFQEVTLKEC